ncbi:MAG: hypothetical protein ACRBDI_05820 [Alphaproteobacteria bacterium]
MITEKFNGLFEPVVDLLNAADDTMKEGEGFKTALRRYVEIRNKKKLTKLFDAFIDVFGAEGESLSARPAKAVYFNGGKDPVDPDKYFPGHHFALPLMAHVMRMALNECDEEKSYKQYIKNVDALVKEQNQSIEKSNLDCAPENCKDLIEISAYPTQYTINEICAPTLRALANLKAEIEEKAEIEIGGSSSGDSDSLDDEGFLL